MRFLVHRAAVVVVVLAAGGWLWVQRSLAPVDEDGGQSSLVAFEVAPGDSLTRVVYALEAKGLIRNAKVSRWFAEAEGLSSQIKVGEYELSAAKSTREILETLAQGRVRTHAVVIPEGQRASEIADRLAAAGLADREAFLEVVFDPETIQDHATFVEPHQYATGMVHVFVNGTAVINNGEHTGAKPGRVVRGQGWTGRE